MDVGVSKYDLIKQRDQADWKKMQSLIHVLPYEVNLLIHGEPAFMPFSFIIYILFLLE